MRPRLAAVLFAALGLALAAAGTAWADGGGFIPVEPESPNAERIRDVYWLILGLTGAVFVLVEGTLLLFVFRYRRRGRSRAVEGAQIHGSTRLEIVLTAAPVLILAAIAAFVFYKLPGIEDVPPAQAGGRLQVKVEARQYYWQFEYPGGEVSIDRLVVPVGQVVTLDLTSPDVIHSFWVPELGGKIDTIPGRTTHTWFRARREGVFKLRCAELCGIEHAHMTGAVEVVGRAEYARFLAAHKPSSAAVGRESFEGACAKCHGLAGEGDIGPSLRGSALLADAAGLERLLREGQRKMPAVSAGWGDEQMRAAIGYLQQRFGQKEGTPGGGQG